jgi:hypothetical protein
LPGRDGYEVEIFGMEGIPAPDVADYKRRKEIELGLVAGSISQPQAKRPKTDNRPLTDEELKAQLETHRALMGGGDTSSTPAAPDASVGVVYGAPPQAYVAPPTPAPAPAPVIPPVMPPLLGAPPFFPGALPLPGAFPGQPPFPPPPGIPIFPSPGQVYIINTNQPSTHVFVPFRPLPPGMPVPPGLPPPGGMPPGAPPFPPGVRPSFPPPPTFVPAGGSPLPSVPQIPQGAPPVPGQSPVSPSNPPLISPLHGQSSSGSPPSVPHPVSHPAPEPMLPSPRIPQTNPPFKKKTSLKYTDANHSSVGLHSTRLLLLVTKYYYYYHFQDEKRARHPKYFFKETVNNSPSQVEESRGKKRARAEDFL